MSPKRTFAIGMRAKEPLKVKSRFIAVQSFGSATYDVLDVGSGEDRLANLQAGKYDIVATGLANIEAAMAWIWKADAARSQRIANDLAGRKE
jgi:hypothetical protein